MYLTIYLNLQSICMKSYIRENVVHWCSIPIHISLVRCKPALPPPIRRPNKTKQNKQWPPHRALHRLRPYSAARASSRSTACRRCTRRRPRWSTSRAGRARDRPDACAPMPGQAAAKCQPPPPRSSFLTGFASVVGIY
ncbi:hypothetical protein C8Q78DRAFT_431992 [Trametes maxima]|nr:hypothetical protein C8Q78DRAFT_431992 [Trametes maxima]